MDDHGFMGDDHDNDGIIMGLFSENINGIMIVIHTEYILYTYIHMYVRLMGQ